MSADQSPQAWFDQFPPLENAASWPAGSQWCPRHWAPCPLLGANGIQASVLLLKIFAEEIATGRSLTPDQLNRQLADASPVCCRLGDERMYGLWGQCPPAAATPDSPRGKHPF